MAQVTQNKNNQKRTSRNSSLTSLNSVPGASAPAPALARPASPKESLSKANTGKQNQAPTIDALQDRIAALEAENRRFKTLEAERVRVREHLARLHKLHGLDKPATFLDGSYIISRINFDNQTIECADRGVAFSFAAFKATGDLFPLHDLRELGKKQDRVKADITFRKTYDMICVLHGIPMFVFAI